MTELKKFFGSEGGLAKVISGYQPRAAQLEMAEAIADAIDSNQNLIAEAGTGTGKTFAYLVPAILSGKKPSSQPAPKIYRISCLIMICR